MLLRTLIVACVSQQVNLLTLLFFGVEKRLPYDLLCSAHAPVYDVEFAQSQLKVFLDIHKKSQNYYMLPTLL